MLLEQENVLLGKIIGLVNGLDSDPTVNELEQDIRNALNAIKNKENLDSYITLMIENKKKYLPNCITCTAPCGRSNDFYLNDISSPEYRNLKEQELSNILDCLNMDYKDLVLALMKLSW